MGSNTLKYVRMLRYPFIDVLQYFQFYLDAIRCQIIIIFASFITQLLQEMLCLLNKITKRNQFVTRKFQWKGLLLYQ